MKVLVVGQGKSEIMTLEEAVKKFRVSEKQIRLAIRTGHRLKTKYFDEVGK